MTPSRSPLYLERRSYRRRRLIDAVRVLPLLGAFALVLPLLWGPGAGTAKAMVFVFAVWAVLILAAVALSRGLAGSDPALSDPQGDPAAPKKGGAR